MIRYSPVARPIPARTARPLPPLTDIRFSVTPATEPAISAVRSFEQSSTTMICLPTARDERSTDCICSSSVPMKRSSLYAGITIDSVDMSMTGMSIGTGRLPRRQVTLDRRQIVRRVDPDGFHRVLGRKRRDGFGPRDPWNKRQEITLTGRAPDLDAARVGRQPIAIALP